MAKQSLSQNQWGLLITLAAAIAYGVWPSAMRGVYAEGGNASFVIIVAMLARPTFLFLDCLIRRNKIFQTPLDTKNAVVGGFFQALSSGFAMAAVLLLPGPLVIVIMFTHTLMLLSYMIWRGEVKADTATIVTTVSALIGLTFVLDLWHKQSQGNLLGMALAFVAALSVASRLYVYGHQMKTRHPATVGTENFLIAILFTPCVLLYQLPHPPTSTTGYWWIVFGCSTLALGTYGQFYAIQRLGSFRYSLYLKLEPLFTTLFAAYLIHDVLKPLQYFGIFMVTGSLAIFQVFEHHRRKISDDVLE